MADTIKVAVRMRPLNKRERNDKDYPGMKASQIFQSDATIVVTDPTADPKDKKASTNFTFDYAFDSSEPDRADCSTQGQVYDSLCDPLIKHVCNVEAGGNACLFAYGLTGTGKTFTMMGAGPTQMSQGTSSSDDGRDKGIIPRAVEEMFRVKDVKFTISYMELYNGRLRDLLLPPPPPTVGQKEVQQDLVVHTHPKLGVYVDGLSESSAEDLGAALKLLDFGTKMRTVASTNMNSTSSRSHAIFQVKVHFPDEGEGEGYVPTRLNLVDLAGRENEKNTAASGERLRELSFINQSLFQLAGCIHALSTKTLPPFRNNNLTLLLSDCLQTPKESGHSGCLTSMLAAITPAASSYADTLATLRFAAATKTIKTKNPLAGGKMTARQKDNLIKQLQAEVTSLREQMSSSSSAGDAQKIEDLTSQIEVAQKMADDFRKKYEDIQASTQNHDDQRAQALAELGMEYSGDVQNASGTHTTVTGLAALTGESPFPLLVNLSDDDYMKASVVYQLKNDEMKAGCDAKKDGIYLTGLGITESMATFSKDKGGSVTLRVTNASGENENRVLVNGKRVGNDKPVRLGHNDRVLFGHAMAFLLVVPTEARKMKSMSDLDEKLSLSNAKEEVQDEGGEQFSLLTGYLDIFTKSRGATAGGALKQKLHNACPLVDEANALTQALRAKDCLKFKVALMDTTYEAGPKLTNVVPEVVVRLVHDPELGKKWKSASVAGKFNHHKVFGLTNEVMAWMHIDKHTHDHLPGGKDEICLHVWNWDKFLARLGAMRDLYDQFHRGRFSKQHSSSQVGGIVEAVTEYLHENPSKDPWREFGLDHVDVLTGHKANLESQCAELSQENSSLKSQVIDLKKQIRNINSEAAQKRMNEVEKDIAALDSVANAIKEALSASRS